MKNAFTEEIFKKSEFLYLKINFSLLFYYGGLYFGKSKTVLCHAFQMSTCTPWVGPNAKKNCVIHFTTK